MIPCNLGCQSQAQVVVCSSDRLAINQTFPQTLPLVWFNVLEQLTELRNPSCLLTRLPIYYKKILKDMNQHPDEEISRVKSQTKDILYPRGAWGLTWWYMETFWFSNLEILQTLFFWVFMEVSLSRHDWLTHWSLVIDLISSPFPLLRKSVSRAESSNPWIIVGVPYKQPPSLGAFQKIHSLI